MRLTRLSLLLPLVFVTSAALAQAQASSNDASHRAAVKQLMEVTRVRQMTDASMETMLKAQLQQMPQIAPFQNVLRDFYKEQLSWAVLEPELTNVYLEVFSEQELRDMIAFYETPLGQRLLDKTPLLMEKTSELTSRRLQAAMPQLMQKLQAAMMQTAPAARADSVPTKKP